MATNQRPAGGGSRNVEVVSLSQAEYNRAVKSELQRLGVSYRKLRAQARADEFTSLRARKLWLAIGEARSGRH